MCGIFAAFTKSELIQLSQANAYRGQHSFSVTGVDLIQKRTKKIPQLKFLIRKIGSFDLSDTPDASFYICHIQAPTGTMQDEKAIHPAESATRHGFLLWHNGIIKEHECDRLRAKQKTDCQWDTMLLLNEISDPGLFLDHLNEINGSFSCIARLWNSNFYLFRNALAPMFIGEGCLSSVFTPLTPNRVKAERFYLIDFSHDVSRIHLNEIARFQTKENPYVGLEDDDE